MLTCPDTITDLSFLEPKVQNVVPHLLSHFDHIFKKENYIVYPSHSNLEISYLLLFLMS